MKKNPKIKDSTPDRESGAQTVVSDTHKNEQSDYTPSPEKTREALSTFLSGLPPELREDFDRQINQKLTEALRRGKSISEIEALLPELRTIPASHILNTDYPDITNIIKDYLTAGMWFIYGKPKIGKSWLAGQFALSVATGGKLFEKDVKQGRVLYLALEDGERRLKKRMTLQKWESGDDIDYMFESDFREQLGYLNMGGSKRLLSYIERHDYLLTVVDTFSRAFNINQLKGELLMDALIPIQGFTQASNRAIIFIDHEPKRNEESDSAITALFGGIQKTGVADGVWRLYKERGKGVKIDIEGRDLEDAYSLKLRFDKSLCFWFSEGDAKSIEITERRQEILTALANLGRSNLGQLEDATGQAKGNLHTRLQDLVTEGMVMREHAGNHVFYSLNE